MSQSSAPHNPNPVKSGKPKERIFYLDLIRALAVILILITHFNNPYLSDGGYLFWNMPFGIYVGNLGVSLFLIISGTALAFTYQRPLDLKKFYWKRFKGIYPMFYLAWIIATVYFFVVTGGRPPNGAPLRTLPWTLTAMDGLAANFHFQTMYILGEWFLGFIVLFYLVFPLMLWGIDRFPVASAVVILAIGAGTWFALQTPHAFPNAVILPLRLPELAFGIYTAKYWRRLQWFWAIPAAAVLLIFSFFPDFNEDISTAVVGIAAFVFLAALGDFIAIRPVQACVSWLAKYSYPIFLVHHVVITELYRYIDTSRFFPVQHYLMFFSMLVIVFALAVGLHRLNAAVMDFARKATARPLWPGLPGASTPNTAQPLQ